MEGKVQQLYWDLVILFEMFVYSQVAFCLVMYILYSYNMGYFNMSHLVEIDVCPTGWTSDPLFRPGGEDSYDLWSKQTFNTCLRSRDGDRNGYY